MPTNLSTLSTPTSFEFKNKSFQGIGIFLYFFSVLLSYFIYYELCLPFSIIPAVLEYYHYIYVFSILCWIGGTIFLSGYFILNCNYNWIILRGFLGILFGLLLYSLTFEEKILQVLNQTIACMSTTQTFPAYIPSCDCICSPEIDAPICLHLQIECADLRTSERFRIVTDWSIFGLMVIIVGIVLLTKFAMEPVEEQTPLPTSEYDYLPEETESNHAEGDFELSNMADGHFLEEVSHTVVPTTATMYITTPKAMVIEHGDDNFGSQSEAIIYHPGQQSAQLIAVKPFTTVGIQPARVEEWTSTFP